MLKTKDVVCSIGRDNGKRFRLVEMPAAKAEKWAARAFLTLNKSNVQIPTDMASLGMVGVAILGLNVFLQGNVHFENIEPLMDEMFTCVRVLVPNEAGHETERAPIEGEIEEWQTRAWLRSEVIELHTGFSPAEALSKLISEMMASASEITKTLPQ